MEKISSPSVKRNRNDILPILKEHITDEKQRLLEIGSGTGEHAIFFAPHFKNLHWVTSDCVENHANIKQWMKEEKVTNVHGPETLKIGVNDFPDKRPFDYVFSANTLHIMSWKESKTLFKLLSKRLRQGAHVFFYGPFNYEGNFTSESNETFDKWLKDQNFQSGIRHFEDVFKAMEKGGFGLVKDHEMPANNRCLVFVRLPH